MKRTRRIPLLAVCLASSPAVAASTEVAVPAAQYRSAFEGYRPFREEPVADWRAVNEEVGRVGGHIGIMRPPSGPAGRAESGQPPARGAPQAPTGHGHH